MHRLELWVDEPSGALCTEHNQQKNSTDVFQGNVEDVLDGE